MRPRPCGPCRAWPVPRWTTWLATLPPGHQEVLRLKLAHGLSYADIAQVTGLSVSHVGVKLHEAMKSLRARLGVRPAAAPGAAR